MYQYDDFDRRVVNERVRQFAGQMQRYLSGQLDEETFLPLRLQNGLYVQKHAPMLRVAVPYGMLSSRQLRALATISRNYDRGYCHVTTRQNLQFNWVELARVPALLADLAAVEMHAIQTSGNCVRNTTADPLAGVCDDELEDPRPYCEIIRQWSTLHPEFAFLPRKFKIAMTGARFDRAGIRVHDIGLRIVANDKGERGFEVWVGGGQGRTPKLAERIRSFLPQAHLLIYLKAILRVYNRYGRRDNKYKARIKILLQSLGIEAMKQQVEEEFNRTFTAELLLQRAEVAHAHSFFSAPEYQATDPLSDSTLLRQLAQSHGGFARWLQRNVGNHRVAGYAIVTVSLKHPGHAPGDISAAQLEHVADLAERFSGGEVRATQQQNLVLADVRKTQLFELWCELQTLQLDSANIGSLTDIVCCPGGDYCNLANARSLPVSTLIQQRFNDLDQLHDLGDISLRISGCINACAHHHVANIGILGVDKNGEEFYQLTLGGAVDSASDVVSDSVDQGPQTRLGKVLGPALPAEDIPAALERLLMLYLRQRLHPAESFIDAFYRLGREAFKQEVYVHGKNH